MKNVIFMLMMLTSYLYATDSQTKQINSDIPYGMEVMLTLPFEDTIIEHMADCPEIVGDLSLQNNDELLFAGTRTCCPNNHKVICLCGGCAISSCGYCCSCYIEYKKF